MTLYHGTNSEFSEIDFSHSKDKRDFGKGFYTTTMYEQAEKWAKNQFYIQCAKEKKRPVFA